MILKVQISNTSHLVSIHLIHCDWDIIRIRRKSDNKVTILYLDLNHINNFNPMTRFAKLWFNRFWSILITLTYLDCHLVLAKVLKLTWLWPYSDLPAKPLINWKWIDNLIIFHILERSGLSKLIKTFWTKILQIQS